MRLFDNPKFSLRWNIRYIHGRSIKPGASPAESKFYFQSFSPKSIFDSSKKHGRWPAVIQYIAIAHFDFDETTQVGGHGPPPPTCFSKTSKNSHLRLILNFLFLSNKYKSKNSKRNANLKTKAADKRFVTKWNPRGQK